jgi:hypothetical protein
MAPLTHDQDVTSWMQLLSAIEESEAGRGTARLTEVCLSIYGALCDARFLSPSSGPGFTRSR